MSKLEEVIPHLRNGGKIRQKLWPIGWFWELKDLAILNHDGHERRIDAYDLTACGWEIYEEPKKRPKLLAWMDEVGYVKYLREGVEADADIWEREPRLDLEAERPSNPS